MGYKDELEEMEEEIRALTEALANAPLPIGTNAIGTYSMYDGTDETKCEHKNVREIKLLTSVVRECIDCGEELK